MIKAADHPVSVVTAFWMGRDGNGGLVSGGKITTCNPNRSFCPSIDKTCRRVAIKHGNNNIKLVSLEHWQQLFAGVALDRHFRFRMQL